MDTSYGSVMEASRRDAIGCRASRCCQAAGEDPRRGPLRSGIIKRNDKILEVGSHIKSCAIDAPRGGESSWLALTTQHKQAALLLALGFRLRLGE